MKSITLIKISLVSICVLVSLAQTSVALSQSTPNTPITPGSTAEEPGVLPTVVTPQAPTVQPSQSDESSGSGANPTASTMTVKCENLNTVVQKGERRAFMLHWHTNYFGGVFTPEKRCQIVSARLQSAADRNGDTFKGLQFGSGILHRQTVICLL